MPKKQPLIAIVGRANVGKSTLFNRLIEQKKSITSPIPGTTRDINYGKCLWRGKTIQFLDTGGVSELSTTKEDKNEKFAPEIKKQTLSALKKADLIVFLVDLKDGLLPQDRKMAADIKKLKKKVIFVGNKADTKKLRDKIIDTDWLKLDFGMPIPISATAGSNTGDLLDIIYETIKIPATSKKQEIKRPIKIAIIGKPNVGKSSILNCLAQEERVIISPIPHTTREPQDALIKYKDNNFLLIDTAGINRKKPKKDILLKEGIYRTLSTIKKADVCLLTLDISKKLTGGDSALAGAILEQNCGVIVVANKWDLIKEKVTGSTDEYKKYINQQFPFMTWAPIIFTSAKSGKRIKKILDLILEIKQQREMTISDKNLERFIKTIVKKHRPKKAKGVKHPYIYEFKQTGINPPKFKVIIGRNETLHSSYLRFIENRLREKFGFTGTSLRIDLDFREKQS